MPIPAAMVTIHPSQFPERLGRELVASLRHGRLNPKFLYDSVRQTQKWLALHAACSPARTDPDVVRIYTRCFEAAASGIHPRRVHLVGLGCGGGTKDTRLLRLLKRQGIQPFYTPCDVSAAMVLTARTTALAVVPGDSCFPLVCDLAQTNDVRELLSSQSPARTSRIFTFFGMIPNFEPGVILPRLAALIRRGDTLLFSANLVPGADYDKGMKNILPQYDNAWTRGWLLSFLVNLGVDPRKGELRFGIEADRSTGLRRIVARFHFRRPQALEIGSDRILFKPGRPLQLFFSYRHTPQGIPKLLHSHGLQVEQQWIAKSEEEGVYLCRRD
jgi:L-histidine N-alpha-methyltransferase